MKKRVKTELCHFFRPTMTSDRVRCGTTGRDQHQGLLCPEKYEKVTNSNEHHAVAAATKSSTSIQAIPPCFNTQRKSSLNKVERASDTIPIGLPGKDTAEAATSFSSPPNSASYPPLGGCLEQWSQHKV